VKTAIGTGGKTPPRRKTIALVCRKSRHLLTQNRVGQFLGPVKALISALGLSSIGSAEEHHSAFFGAVLIFTSAILAHRVWLGWVGLRRLGIRVITY